MNDAVVVRILHRLTNESEQTQPIRNGEFATVAVFVDLQSIDIIHDDVRHTVREGQRAPVQTSERRTCNTSWRWRACESWLVEDRALWTSCAPGIALLVPAGCVRLVLSSGLK